MTAAEHSEPDPQGEIPDVGEAAFAGAPNRLLDDAQALSATGHEVVGTVVAEDGSEHEITVGSHDFEPSGVAGRLLMRARAAVEGHERAIALGTAGTIVTVAAALAVKKTFRERRKS